MSEVPPRKVQRILHNNKLKYLSIKKRVSYCIEMFCCIFLDVLCVKRFENDKSLLPINDAIFTNLDILLVKIVLKIFHNAFIVIICLFIFAAQVKLFLCKTLQNNNTASYGSKIYRIYF